MDIQKLRQEMQEELTGNILPYWMNKMTDHTNGGFYGRITGTEVLEPEAEKGAILNARILWTFSAAYRLFRKEEYLATATRAKRYLIDHFYDTEYGGVYWSVDYKGQPLDTKSRYTPWDLPSTVSVNTTVPQTMPKHWTMPSVFLKALSNTVSMPGKTAIAKPSPASGAR